MAREAVWFGIKGRGCFGVSLAICQGGGRGEEVFFLRLDHGGIKIMNVSILNPTMLAIGKI
jgi:hypothetical protein